MQDLAGVLDVGVHLGDQRLHAGVLHLAAQPRVEVDGDLDPVELEVVAVEDVGLDAALQPVEGRVGADGDGGGPALGVRARRAGSPSPA